MARLSDWEVSALVHRVEELRRERRRVPRDPIEIAGPDDRGLRRAVRGAARLRLAPPPRRRGRPHRRAQRARGGPAHHRADRRVRRHRRPSPRCPTSSPRTGSATSSSSSRRAAPTSSPPTAAGSSSRSATRSCSSTTTRSRPTTPPRGSSPSSAATPGCPTSASASPRGSVVMRLGDVFGPPVNLASRLTGVARRNRIIIDAAHRRAAARRPVRDPAAAGPAGARVRDRRAGRRTPALSGSRPGRADRESAVWPATRGFSYRTTVLVVQDVGVDQLARRVWHGVREIPLSRTEHDLLHALVAAPGDIVAATS